MILLHLLTSLLLSFHPFHVSVMSIHHAPDEKALQITLKIFADDLEEALNDEGFKASGHAFVDVLNPKDQQKLDAMVERYLQERFSLKVNGKDVQAFYLGKEMEDLAMWCYFEIKDVEEVKNIEVKSSILTEIFDDQTNIVHVDYGGVVKSMKLAGNHLIDKISFG